MESAEQQLQRCIDTLRNVGDPAPVADLLWADLPSLVESAESARLLVARVAALDETVADAGTAEERLLEALLDDARRAGEDGRATGRGFIEAARAGLEALDPDAVTDAGIVVLGRIHHRAGVAVPAVIQSWQLSRLADEQLAEDDDPAALAGRLADSLVELCDNCDGHLLAVHQVIGDSLATMPEEATEALVHEVARWEGPYWQPLTLYWLLDPQTTRARAAAHALHELADAGRLGGDTAGRLGWIRALLPDGEVLQAVDRALAAYRKRHREWPQPPEAGGFDQALASVPDGAGAQYLAFGRASARGRDWAMVLVKAGQGIRDAYVLRDLDAETDEGLWGQLATAADIRAVGREATHALLAAALAENHANGEAPPPGLIEALETSGLTDLRPWLAGGRAWLSVLDPDERLAHLTSQKRGRLINRSGRHAEHLSVLASWFEDSAEAVAHLGNASTRDKRERALRGYLESRRGWWAELCLRSALVVPAAEAGELRDSLAVTGLALLDGRELRRIPLMTRVVETTLAALEPGGGDGMPPVEVVDRGGMIGEPAAEAEAAAIDALEDPGRARLQPLFDNNGPLAEASFGGYFGLHGYLFALATHPKLVPPSQWLAPLFEALTEGGREFDSETGAVVNDVLELYNGINERVLASRPVLPEGCTVKSPATANVGPGAPLGRWAAGFRFALQRFGHVGDHPIDFGEDSAQTNEGLGIATELIDFLAHDPQIVAPADRADGSFERIAALACESLPQNQRLLCSARQVVEDGAPDAGDEAAEAASGAETPPGPQAILERLEEPGASYQWRAMDQAVAQAPAITPLLLERLQSAADEPESALEQDHPGLLYAMALLAYFGETAAHEPLLRLAALPEDLQEPLLGYAITELLPVVLWQTSGGETAGLKRVIEDREAYGFGRGAAAEALSFGVLRHELDRGEVTPYLASLLASEDFAPPADPAWFGVIRVLLELAPDEHETVIRDHLRASDGSGLGIRESDLDRALSEDRTTALARYRRAARLRLPDDVHGYLSHWLGFQPGDPEGGSGNAHPFAGPYPGEPGFGGGAPRPGGTKPRGPGHDKKKRKRKQQKKSRKANRKRR